MFNGFFRSYVSDSPSLPLNLRDTVYWPFPNMKHVHSEIVVISFYTVFFFQWPIYIALTHRQHPWSLPWGSFLQKSVHPSEWGRSTFPSSLLPLHYPSTQSKHFLDTWTPQSIFFEQINDLEWLWPGTRNTSRHMMVFTRSRQQA